VAWILFQASTMSTMLPTELWCKIFLDVYRAASTPVENELAPLVLGGRELVGRITSDEHATLNLTSVCRSWREATLSMPRLWTTASCPLGDDQLSDQRSLQHLDLALALSGTLRLHVRITLSRSSSFYGGVGIHQPVQALMPHLHRVQHLLVTIQHSPNPQLTLVEDGRAPPMSSNLTRQQRTLWLSNPMHLLARDRVFSGIPVTSLSTLALYDVAFARASELFALLRHCSGLEQLTILGNTENMILDVNDTRYFHLPSVWSFTIDHAHLSIMSEIGLHMPKLSLLHVCKLDFQQEADDIDWSFAKPTTRLVFNRGFRDQEVTHSLHDLPNLQRLTLMQCESGPGIGHVLSLWSPHLPNPTGFPAPRLERLVVVRGLMDDADAKRMLRTRSTETNPGLPDLELILVDCVNVSQATLAEIEQRGRGGSDLSRGRFRW